LQKIIVLHAYRRFYFHNIFSGVSRGKWDQQHRQPRSVKKRDSANIASPYQV